MSTLAAPNGYSSIFASGLLATPRPARTQSGSHTPSRPSSPIGMDIETTPTALRTIFSDFTFGSPNPSLPLDTDDDAPHSRSRASSVASTSSTSGAPRLRRRKSSLTVGTTTLSSIKSPLRTARAAASVSRARGGSLSAAGFELEVPPMTMEHVNEPPMTAPISGRMRSGSLGHALRPRRTVRKPAAAPPTMPLPPPPVTGFGMPAERRPLAHRAHTSDNFSSFAHVGGHLHKGMALDSPVDGVFWDGGNSMKEN